MKVFNKHRSGSRPGGYILMEVILALTIFSVAVLGLVNSLNTGIDAANILSQENDIRIALRSFVEEVRRKPVAEMAAETFDARLQATFASTLEEMTLKDRNGAALKDMYLLHVQATYGEGTDARKEEVNVYVYKPQLTQ